MTAARGGTEAPAARVQGLFDDALGRHRAGHYAEAEQLYRQILVLDDRHADSLHLLGAIAQQTGRPGLARDLIGKAIAAADGVALYHSNLGIVLASQGELEDAVACYRRAIARDPRFMDAYNNLGFVLRTLGQTDEAASACHQALLLDPNRADAHNNLGNAFKDQQRNADARLCYETAVRLKPDFVEAHCNLGIVLTAEREFDRADACFRRALELDPDYADAHIGLGNALLRRGRTDEARQSYRQANRLKPVTRLAAAKAKADFSVLLLHTPANANTPCHYLVRRAAYDSHFVILMAGVDYDAERLRPFGDVVVNLVSDVDRSDNVLPLARDLVERLGRPVINPPGKVLATGRETVAERLAGIPHCRVPRTWRLAGAALASGRLPDSVAAVGYPLLARVCGTHGGEDFEQCRDPAAVAAFAARRPDADYYISEFIPYRSSDGYFRKYRFFYVDGTIFPYHLAIAEQWKVHRFRTPMAEHAWMRDEEMGFLEAPTAVFPAQAWQALGHIRAAIGLDYFGIDCALDGDGDLVVFEVNATMLAHGEGGVFAAKESHIARIKQAFDAMLARAARRGMTGV